MNINKLSLYESQYIQERLTSLEFTEEAIDKILAELGQRGFKKSALDALRKQAKIRKIITNQNHQHEDSIKHILHTALQGKAKFRTLHAAMFITPLVLFITAFIILRAMSTAFEWQFSGALFSWVSLAAVVYLPFYFYLFLLNVPAKIGFIIHQGSFILALWVGAIVASPIGGLFK